MKERASYAIMRRVRRLFGRDPRALSWFLIPTGLALVVDLFVRAGVMAGWALQGKAIYASSWLVSAAFWTFPLWVTARLSRRIAVAVYTLWFWPLFSFCYGGQVLYQRVVHAYMGRDTVRLGFAFRGTVADWFKAWGSGLALVAMIVVGLLITLVMRAVVNRVSRRLRGGPVPIIPVATFFVAIGVFAIDMVDSRFLQAALPDVCFLHGVERAVQVAIVGGTRHGITLRRPAPLPPLESKGTKPNVIVILTESVRADALCSEPPPACRARFLDEVAPDRIALGKLTTPTSGTFGSCVLLWTGLPANTDVKAAHSAPVLWEVARAVGYRTAYVTSQNLQFENFGAFVQNAGIDTLVSGADLGDLRQEQLGAPDERATAKMLATIGAGQGPFFGILHLSNTHAPYRVDESLQPNEPHSTNPVGDRVAFANHYRNSVLLQERTVSAFIGELKKLPTWDDTIVLFLSDHGEEFRERGGLYHLHSLYDEEVRIPGFAVGGAHVMTEERRSAIGVYANRRTYLTDINATVVDLFGVDRSKLPFGNPQSRSLIDAAGARSEPVVLMSTTTAVWEQDDAKSGVMQGDRLLVGHAGTRVETWTCFDIYRDAGERNPLPATRCPKRMVDAASQLGQQ